MGSDNLHHKRKARKVSSLQRKKARRTAYKKILIVCEGEKTEPYYFEGARQFYSLATVDVEVRGDSGSDPKSIVRFAKQRYREARDAGDPFDNVYCVFDKDTHAGYTQAVSDMVSATPKGVFYAITSVPCFEYWLLLHFEYSMRPYQPLPGNSAGNQVLSDLKAHFPDYQKGHKKIFPMLQGKITQAKKFAKKGLEECELNHADNPSTRVHELIEVLETLKK